MPNLLKSMTLTNIRAFKELELHFGTSAPRPITCIIGRNGTNKSTLLRAIALLYAGFKGVQLVGPNPRMRRVGTREGGIDGRGFPNASLCVTRFDEQGNISSQVNEELGRAFVCGYGPGRGEAEFSRNTDDPLAPFRSLFEFSYPQFGTAFGLQLMAEQLGDHFPAVLTRIKAAIGLTESDTIRRDGSQVFLGGPTIGADDLPLEAVADGYRRTLTWIVDLYHEAQREKAIDAFGDIEGILLLDEVEQHLHPALQGTILDRLHALFPKMQIIATTHSPMVALSRKPEELIVLKREGDHVINHWPPTSLEGFSVQDMLSHADLFDTRPYAPEFNQAIEEYDQLVSVPEPDRTPEQKSRIAHLATKLSSHQILGPSAVGSETTALLQAILTKLG